MHSHSRRWLFFASGAIATLSLVSLVFLRLHEGALFLIAIGGDESASLLEIECAKRDAAAYFLPACFVIVAIFFLAWQKSARAGHAGILRMVAETVGQHRWLCALFTLATLADIATTLAFFHRDGVETELHPGIRLVSFALGRTVGPLAAKLLQAAGLFVLASAFPRWSKIVLLVASLAYAAGAIANLMGGLPAQ